MTSIIQGTAAALVAMGSFGVLGSSVLFPCLARTYPASRKGKRPSPVNAIPSLDVLIPAHDEEKTIAATLKSVLSAVQSSEGIRSVSIRIGADSCSDGTVAIARSLGVDVSEYPDHRSKWKTIRALIRESSSDWVALVDSGSIWPSSLLRDVVSDLRDPAVCAIAPAYDPSSTGNGAESWHWAVERSLKTLESRAGGPISVHGATILYRREKLLAALAELDKIPVPVWLNDDVAIPLMMRIVEPEMRIAYRDPGDRSRRISDLGLDFGSGDQRRRRRMIIGNVQWISCLWGRAWRENPRAALIASRRVFRLLWGYWLLFFGVSALLVLSEVNLILSLSFVCAGVLIALSRPGKRIFGAWLESVRAPFEWMRFNPRSEAAWK